MVYYLDKQLLERIGHRLAIEIFDSKDDPISPFQEHDNSLLESALSNPRATFGSKDLYPSLIEKVAILYYTLNKNHPFKNGNKRISLCSLLVFLHINNHWLDAGITEMVDTTLYVAKSSAQEKDKVLDEIKEWIKQHLIQA